MFIQNVSWLSMDYIALHSCPWENLKSSLQCVFNVSFQYCKIVWVNVSSLIVVDLLHILRLLWDTLNNSFMLIWDNVFCHVKVVNMWIKSVHLWIIACYATFITRDVPLVFVTKSNDCIFWIHIHVRAWHTKECIDMKFWETFIIC
jgi:hypothetical protein